MRPPSRGEWFWLILVVATAVLYLPYALTQSSYMHWIAKPSSEGRPLPGPYTPLPDLCTALPVGTATALAVPKSRPDTHDRNESRCTFSGPAATLTVQAVRPDPSRRYLAKTEAQLAADAEEYFAERLKTSIPLPGLGDEAKVERRSGAIVIRKGLTVLTVTYLHKTRSEAARNAASARAATELLALIPAR